MGRKGEVGLLGLLRGKRLAFALLVMVLLLFVFWRIGNDKYAEHVVHDQASLKSANKLIASLRKDAQDLKEKNDALLAQGASEVAQLKADLSEREKEAAKWKDAHKSADAELEEVKKQLVVVKKDLEGWKKRPHPDSVSHQLLNGVIDSLKKEQAKYKPEKP